ncbi:MAG: hypothetical protein NTW01_10055 [Gammaproteobacteria bacterium]|nr:hypothetical protein [Gammaproteobacteria bacterium]
MFSAHVDDRLVSHALTHAKQVLDHYGQLPASYQQKTPDILLKICREYIHKHIEIIEIDLEGKDSMIRALYMSLDKNSYEVYVLAGQEDSWRNFAACKELFHVVLDDPGSEDCRTTDLYGHAEGCLFTMSVADSSPGKNVTSEILAEIAAMEFLFPYVERKRHFSEASPLNIDALAKLYPVPPALIEHYMSEHYMDGFAKFYE